MTPAQKIIDYLKVNENRHGDKNRIDPIKIRPFDNNRTDPSKIMHVDNNRIDPSNIRHVDNNRTGQNKSSPKSHPTQ